jgi:hypothetical protein
MVRHDDDPQATLIGADKLDVTASLPDFGKAGNM